MKLCKLRGHKNRQNPIVITFPRVNEIDTEPRTIIILQSNIQWITIIGTILFWDMRGRSSFVKKLG